MDNIQLCYIDNEINKIDKMKQGDVIYKNGMELLVVLSYDHNEPCKGCFFYKNKACGSINRKRLIGNTYQIYRSILHQLAIDENWNNVYSDITLPSGDMGTIKVERVDDERESKGV